MINRFLRWAGYKNRFNRWNADEVALDLFVFSIVGFACFVILYYFDIIDLSWI